MTVILLDRRVHHAIQWEASVHANRTSWVEDVISAFLAHLALALLGAFVSDMFYVQDKSQSTMHVASKTQTINKINSINFYLIYYIC